MSRIIRDFAGVTSRSTKRAGLASAYTAQPLTNDTQSFVRQSRKSGFTLAEVLITLGIIGVVAAMTLPTLTQNIKYKEFESRYKVAQNLIYNAINHFHSIEREIYGATYCTANNNADNNYCQNGSYEIFSDVLADAFIGIHALNKKGGGYPVYRNFNNTAPFDAMLLDDGYMELTNGMSILIESGGSTTLPIISVDLNGTKNKPNRFGYDVFAFVIDKGDRVCPLGAPNCNGRSVFVETTEDFTKSNYCSPSSTSNRNGYTCGYFASIDKDYFSNLK